MARKTYDFFLLNQIISVLEELISNKTNIRITVTGKSMFPFFREEITALELTKINYKSMRVCDVVLVKRKNNDFVIHRTIQKNNNYFYINGDAQLWIEGPLFPNQLIAKITSFRQDNKWISCNNIFWILFSKLWVFCLPHRCLIFKILMYLAKIKHFLLKLK